MVVILSEPQCINTLKSGYYCADNFFKFIFLNDDVLIWNKIQLKFIPSGLIQHMTALVPVMTWHQASYKPLSEPMLTMYANACMCH